MYNGYDFKNLQVTKLNSKNNNEKVDECSQFLDLRFVSAPEAIWRIFEFDMHQQSHTVQQNSPIPLQGSFLIVGIISL